MKLKAIDFTLVEVFEKKIAEYFGAPYAVAVDSCTHGIELCLRLVKAKYISSARNTYLSIPMLANKLDIPLFWKEKDYAWVDYYEVYKNIYDAAVLWRRDSYIKGSMMCVSMQYQKHLSIGRLGVILLDSKERWLELKKMSYDGRLPNIPWREQDISTFGFHYYAQPELCSLALDKLPNAIKTEPRKWIHTDWNDLFHMTVFKNKYQKIYNEIIERAQLENRTKDRGVYYERHHIIPKCLGGSNDKTNLVLLTAKEHFIAHKLLCLISPQEYKLKVALWKMMICRSGKNQDRNYYISPREFQKIKKEISENNKLIQLKRWSSIDFKKLQSIKISQAQLKSYKQDPTRAQRLSKGQIQSYKNSNRALRLSKTQKQRYQNSEERLKTGIAIRKSKTPKILKKMSDRFSGIKGNQWKGYVYIFNPEGKLKYKFDTLKSANQELGSVIIKNNRIGKKGKWKGYKFIISKENLKYRIK